MAKLTDNPKVAAALDRARTQGVNAAKKEAAAIVKTAIAQANEASGSDKATKKAVVAALRSVGAEIRSITSTL